LNELNVAEMKKELAEKFIAAGVSKDEASRIASKEVDSLGVVKTATGQCPLRGAAAMACMFCQYGHLTDCHYPRTCEEANCSHYQEEMAGEIVELDEEHAGLFDQAAERYFTPPEKEV